MDRSDGDSGPSGDDELPSLLVPDDEAQHLRHRRAIDDTLLAQQVAEYRRSSRWNSVRVALAAAVLLGALVRLGWAIHTLFFAPPDVRVVRVDLAQLRRHAEANLRYPGATVLRHRDQAGVTTLYAHYAPSGQAAPGSRTSFAVGVLKGYSGEAVPATADHLLAIRAGQVGVERWYRHVLLRRGWCVLSREDTSLPGTTMHVVRVTLLRGHETYELDLGNTYLVRELYGLGLPRPPDDPRKVEQYIRMLEAHHPGDPLTVRTQYALYPDLSYSLDACPVAPART